MPRSLGKMSAYKLFNWRDRAANTILETVQAFLELGEAVATRWIQTHKGVMLLQMVPGDNASPRRSSAGRDGVCHQARVGATHDRACVESRHTL